MATRRFGRYRGPRGRARGARRNQGQWFPTLGTTWDSGDDTYYDAGFTLSSGPLFQTRAEGPQVTWLPIVPDFTISASQDAPVTRGASLHDQVSGNEWLLKRLVGKIHVHAQENSVEVTSGWQHALVACAFFVSRSQDDTDQSPDLFEYEMDPLARDNIKDPWLWRRTWMLSNPGSGAVLRDDFPISNSAFGDIASGPHIDTKVKRRIRREHRLWFVMAAQGWNGTATQNSEQDQPSVTAYLDIRVFGKLILNGKSGGTF